MPLADRLDVRVPVVVIGPPANVIKSESAVDIEVTVPIPVSYTHLTLPTKA